MAKKLRPANSPAVEGTDQNAEELPENLRDDLAQTLLSVLHSISGKASDPEEDLPVEAIDAIARFHAISCDLATVSDQFTCAAPPFLSPPAEG